MAGNKGNKAKGRRSSKNANYYKEQVYVTKANKARRAKAYARWLEKRRAKRAATVTATA